jgi:hypothetical protein
MQATNDQNGFFLVQFHLQQLFLVTNFQQIILLTPTFSPVVANGALNHCSNVEQDLKMEGNKKFSKAQSSGNLFCSGVPVNKRRWGAK